MALLREYCMGDKPCKMEYLSDQSVNFPDRFASVNYQDPNYNVSIPVFSIHGNHDDPSGDGNLAALDLLSVSGLVNYFGRAKEVDEITISPILLRKGNSRLALYGLGNIRDERLHRTFIQKKVKILRPRKSSDVWFNLMVLHQNRIAHGATNYIPESFLDEFLDLILWGHEHECLIDPTMNQQQQFYITQPGSSVATSLCEGESQPKHVAILNICNNEFEMEKYPLRSVRPFVIEDLILSEIEGLRPTDSKGVIKHLNSKITDLVRQAKENWKQRMVETGEPVDANTEFPKPLIRLRVEYSGGFNSFNPQRFGQQFVEQVANPKDIIHFYRRRTYTDKKKVTAITDEQLARIIPERLDHFKVEDLIEEFLNTQKLDVLPETELIDAVRIFVEKDDRDAIKEFVAGSLDQTRGYLNNEVSTTDDSELRREASNEKKRRLERYLQTHTNRETVVIDHKPTKERSENASDVQSSSENEIAAPLKIRKTGTASKRGGRKAAATTSRPKVVAKSTRTARSRTKIVPSESEISEDDVLVEATPSENDDVEEEVIPSTSTRGRKRKATTTEPTQSSNRSAGVLSRGGRQSKLNFLSSQADNNAGEEDTFASFTSGAGNQGRRNLRRTRG
ncbi:meiotic recombination [Basidiobolus ranarum]